MRGYVFVVWNVKTGESRRFLTRQAAENYIQTKKAYDCSNKFEMYYVLT